MKRTMLVIIVLIAAVSLSAVLKAHAQQADAFGFEPFYVYSDKKADKNHFAPSGWMGDYKDVFYSDGWPNNPAKGSTCIKVIYKAGSAENERWAGIYWQYPPNNWGDKRKAFDLRGAKKLSFWIRGEKGGEVINDVFMGGIKGKYPDSCSVAIGPVDLSTEWRKFEISLDGQDLSKVSGGFGWSTNLSSNPAGCTFYIDEIRYE